MLSVRARVKSGRLVLDEPTDLPDGSEVVLVAADVDDELDDAERQALEASIDQGLAEVRAGRPGVDAADVLARLGQR